jgi:hypothetical protein
MISPSQRPLPDNTQLTTDIHPSMPPVGFEPTISAGERLQTHDLDRAATVTGHVRVLPDLFYLPSDIDFNDRLKQKYLFQATHFV